MGSMFPDLGLAYFDLSCWPFKLRKAQTEAFLRNQKGVVYIARRSKRIACNFISPPHPIPTCCGCLHYLGTPFIVCHLLQYPLLKPKWHILNPVPKTPSSPSTISTRLALWDAHPRCKPARAAPKTMTLPQS